VPLGVVARLPGRWPGGLQENHVDELIGPGRGLYARYPTKQAIDIGGTSVQNRLNIAFGFAIFIWPHVAHLPGQRADDATLTPPIWLPIWLAIWTSIRVLFAL